MTAFAFLASGCESLGGSGLEDGRWERATEEGRIKRARCVRSGVAGWSGEFQRFPQTFAASGATCDC
jgi:hypothetical protein